MPATSRAVCSARWRPGSSPGVTTHKIDSGCRGLSLDNGARPACLGYGGFPGAVCMEVNEVVVHGFPSTHRLRDDIIGLDVVVELRRLQWRHVLPPFPVGEVDRKGDGAYVLQ